MANIKETDMSDMSKQQVWIVKHKLNESQRYYVLPRYRSRKKSKVVAYLLWLPFGLHYFYLGKSTRNILLWLSLLCFGLGVLWQRIRKYGKHSSDASAFERDASRHGGGCGGVRSKRSWWQKVYTNFFAARDACEVQLVLYCL